MRSRGGRPAAWSRIGSDHCGRCGCGPRPPWTTRRELGDAEYPDEAAPPPPRLPTRWSTRPSKPIAPVDELEAADGDADAPTPVEYVGEDRSDTTVERVTEADPAEKLRDKWRPRAAVPPAAVVVDLGEPAVEHPDGTEWFRYCRPTTRNHLTDRRIRARHCAVRWAQRRSRLRAPRACMSRTATRPGGPGGQAVVDQEHRSARHLDGGTAGPVGRRPPPQLAAFPIDRSAFQRGRRHALGRSNASLTVMCRSLIAPREFSCPGTRACGRPPHPVARAARRRPRPRRALRRALPMTNSPGDRGSGPAEVVAIIRPASDRSR